MTQDEALTIIKTGRNVFLTGGPGSGKTYTIGRYVSYLHKQKIYPAITASTGIAATHINGRTIHSWSGINISRELSPKGIANIVERIWRRLKKTSVLIIDEISMADAKTLSLVDQVCRVGKDPGRPFGGMQVVLVGDFFQLPPVTRKGELPQFAFASEAWKEAELAVCYLTEQHRQQDTVFLEVLTALRQRSFGAQHRAHLDQRRARGEECNTPTITKLFPHNNDVDRINEAELAKLPGAAQVFTMKSSGYESFVKQLKKGCLSPEILRLKVGARVMFTKNNFEAKFVNGTTGRVIGFCREDRVPIVETDRDVTIAAKPMKWTIGEGGKILAAITQVPLRLAWAITVHKSQGMSLDAAFMDLSKAFEYGQGYVALSRVRTLDGLYLAGLNDRALQVHPEIARQDAEFRALSGRVRDEFHNMNFVPTWYSKHKEHQREKMSSSYPSSRAA